MPQRQVRTVPNCADDREDSTGAVLPPWLFHSFCPSFPAYMADVEVAALVVDTGSGMSWLVLLVTIHLMLCSLRLTSCRASRTLL